MPEKVFYVVTGASKGLGRAIAVSLASSKDGIFQQHVNGSIMVLVARNKNGLEETSAMIKKVNADLQVKIVQADLGNLETLSKDVDQLLATPDCNEIDSYTTAILVNNAASLGDVTKKLSDHDNLKEIRDYFDLNITSAVFLTSTFYQRFKATSVKKIIVNISSKLALQPTTYMSLYCMGKVGRDMGFNIMASENDDVRVLNYSPGPLETDMSMEVQEKTGDGATRDFFKQIRSDKTIVDCYDSTNKMIKLLKEDTYKSGDHIDYYDVE